MALATGERLEGEGGRQLRRGAFDYLNVAAGRSSTPKRARSLSELLRTEKLAFATRDSMRAVCCPIVEPYLRNRNDSRLEPLLTGAIGLALTERLVRAPLVVALAPLARPAA